MDTSNIKSKALSGLVWQFAQRLVSQLVSFVVTVILARLLMPSDYGVVALASMFITLLGTFTDGGLNAALIQKKDADELDYNTVFYTCLGLSIIIYGVIFFSAPLFASLYHNPLICPVIRVLSLTMLIGSLASVQNASIARELKFKKFFQATLVGLLLSAFVGISMAYMGYGPWALVGQSITSAVANTLVMFFLVKWHPKPMYSFERFKELFKFAGSKFGAGLIGTFCDQLKGYLIGYKYTTADLAYFNRGEGLPDMLRNNISGSINGVLFPALSRLNGDTEAVKRGIRRSMMTSSYILTPLFIGLAAVSSTVVPLLYGPRWLPAIPFMQVACLTSCVIVLNNANLQSIYAIGRADEVLKLEIYKKPVMIAILIIAIFISPLAISVGMLIYSFYVLWMNTRPNKKYLHYSLLEQINDVKAGFLLSLVMAALVLMTGMLIPNQYIALPIQIVIGAGFYLSASQLLKIEAYTYVKQIAKETIHRKFHKRNDTIE